MSLTTKNTLCFFVIFVFLSLELGCVGAQNNAPVEEKLLTVFKNEAPILAEYQNDYAGYMTHQIDRFDKTQKKTVGFIKEINKKFDGLSEPQKTEYQKKWQLQFQPVIKKIEELTKNMIAYQKANLNAQSLSTIEELSLKMKKMEKKFNDVKLKPQFY